ncbi:hypothetical protein E8E15_005644 [Penicillium rubens]|nr:hypothetical protein E8E15_005644 [Penicillium rubens]
MKNASYSKAVTIAFVDKASVKSTRTVTDRHPVDPDPKGTPSKKKSQRCNSQCGDWDGDELYITKAYALDKYIAIVRDRDRNAITKNDFLKIRQWGAWKIDKREDVEDFARLSLSSMWDPIIGDYVEEESIQASHLFPYMNGQDTMDAIFGKKRSEELFSPRNGLLLHTRLERYWDAGKFVIVPDIPSFQGNALVSAVKYWLECEPREYRVRLIDPDWEKLDESVSRQTSLTFRQLEGRPLKFRSGFRPAARYLYFHYCVQVLRMCWQHSNRGKSSQAAALLQAEKGRPFWGTAGRYLPHNMLLALVEEMGHEYSFVMNGAAGSRANDDKLLLALLSKNVKARPSILAPGIFDNACSSEEDVSGVDDDDDDDNEDELGE